jgi:hypothetical protein
MIIAQRCAEVIMPTTSPLFSTTWWLLRAAAALCVLTVLAMAVGLVAVPVIASNLDADHFGIPEMIEGMSRGEVLAFAAFVLATGAVTFAMLALMFAITAAIVRTALDGDPFVAENAARLRRVGWLLLGVQALGIGTMVVYGFLPKALHEVYLGFGPSPAGLLAILVIFVLARIFRHGAEMRADLEGTV